MLIRLCLTPILHLCNTIDISSGIADLPSGKEEEKEALKFLQFSQRQKKSHR